MPLINTELIAYRVTSFQMENCVKNQQSTIMYRLKSKVDSFPNH